MADTIREQILDAIEAHFKAQAQGVPGTDPYTITWSTVEREDIDDVGHGKKYALAILDTTEQVDFGVSTTDGVTMKTLRLVLEWKSLLAIEDRPSKKANVILGEIVRRMLEDETYGGLAIWIQESGSEYFADSSRDKVIEGSVFFNVLYRHSRRDPRKVIC